MKRNTGHLGKKKKMLCKFSWQERAAGTFPNRIPSNIFFFRCHSGTGVMNGLLWGRERRPLFLPGHTQNNISTALRQIDPPGSISVVRMQLADLQLQGVKISPRKRWEVAVCSRGTVMIPATYASL